MVMCAGARAAAPTPATPLLLPALVPLLLLLLLLLLSPLGAASSRGLGSDGSRDGRRLQQAWGQPANDANPGFDIDISDIIGRLSPIPNPNPKPSPTPRPIPNPRPSPRPSPNPSRTPSIKDDPSIYVRGIPEQVNAEFESLNNATEEVPPKGGYPTGSWPKYEDPEIDDDTEQLPEEQLVELVKMQLEQLLDDDRLLLRRGDGTSGPNGGPPDTLPPSNRQPGARGLRALPSMPLSASLVKPWIVWPWFPWGLRFWNVSTEWTDYKRLCVYVNKAPVDIMFMADTTGSMSGIINAVKAAAGSLMTSLSGTIPDLHVGVAGYKDNGDVYVYRRFAPTAAASPAAFSATVGSAWSASGGGDWPEANLYALRQVASGVGADDSGWRPSAIKIVVWFGDAPGHDPSNGVNLAAARNALVSKGIKVIALDAGSLDYSYGGPPATQQASYMATQTGGYYGSVTSTTVAASIINSVANINVVIKPEVTCPVNAPFIIEFDPDTVTASPSRPGCFGVRVKMCDSEECAPGGTYVCTVKFIDQSNNNVIDVRPIVIHTAPGPDTSPPWFPYVPPSPEVRECPAQFSCPALRADDNCDEPVHVAASKHEVTYYGPGGVELPAGEGPVCRQEHTCVWEHSDGAGNAATPVQLDAVVQDTTPPALSSYCAGGALCFDPKNQCLAADQVIKRCFRDACNEVVKWDFQCEDSMCFTPNGENVGRLACREGTDSTLCLGFPMQDIPHCCTVWVTVTDACGNSNSYPMTVCYSRDGSSYPMDCLAPSLYLP